MFTTKQIDNPLFAIEGSWVVEVPKLTLVELSRLAGLDESVDYILQPLQRQLDTHTMFANSPANQQYADSFGTHELGWARFKLPGFSKATQAFALQDFGLKLAGITHQLAFGAAHWDEVHKKRIIQLGTTYPDPHSNMGGFLFTTLEWQIYGQGDTARWGRSLGLYLLSCGTDMWPHDKHHRVLVIK